MMGGQLLWSVCRAIFLSATCQPPHPCTHVLHETKATWCVCVHVCQADAITAQHVADADAAGGALSALAAGFELEEATSRRSTAAPPSPYLMAGNEGTCGVEGGPGGRPACGV
jgi:hypothetical protein